MGTLLSEQQHSDIASAIRGQNGLSTRYWPGDMAAAVHALEWDVGLKPRAVLTALGTLEFNYVDGCHCYFGGTPLAAWEDRSSRLLVGVGKAVRLGQAAGSQGCVPLVVGTGGNEKHQLPV